MMNSELSTRDRIISAAFELFCQRGFHGVGTDEICQLAGVHKGSMYHFFPSKLDIALETIHNYGEIVRKEFAAIVDQNVAPRQKLVLIFELEQDMSQRHVHTYGAIYGCLIGNFTFELATTEPAIRQRVQAVYESWIAELAKLIRELVTHGDIPNCDPHQSARQLQAYINGVVLAARVADDPTQIASFATAALVLLGGQPLPKARGKLK